MADCDPKTCGGNCEGCSAKQDLHEPMNEHSNVAHVIGIVSGKGGVGKSLVTALIANSLAEKGFKVGIMDADVTGPSIPKMYGLHKKAKGSEMGIIPEITVNGIRVMSINLLLEDEGSPVVWRGPVIAGVVKQFWTDVVWGELDYLLVDMPPGTGDVPLTVFQSLPVDGIVIVTSPQDLVKLIVSKAVKMAEMMNIPVLGLVENYSYVECPDCGKKISVFGESHLARTAEEFGIPVLGEIPIKPTIAAASDDGLIDQIRDEYLDTEKLIKYESK